MSDRKWLGVVALGIACAIVGAAARPVFAAASEMMILGGVLLLVGLVMAARPLFRRHDPYSLEELRRLDEEERLREASWAGTDDADEIVCIHCGAIRDADRPRCPNCGALS